MPRHLQRPQPLLTQVDIEVISLVRPDRPRDDLSANSPVRLLSRDDRLLAVERVGPAVPRADDVPVSVERDQSGRPWVADHARHEREIATGGVSDRGNPPRVRVEESRALFSHPSEGILQVIDDRGELRFGGETIVNRDDGEPGIHIQLALPFRDASAMPHDEGAAVNPHDRRSCRPLSGDVDIGPYLVLLHRLVGIGALLGGHAWAPLHSSSESRPVLPSYTDSSRTRPRVVEAIDARAKK